MKKAHLILFFVLIGLACFGSDSISTTVITVRKPSAQRIQKFENDNDFRYSNEIKSTDGLFTKIIKWLQNKIAALLGKTSYNNFWRYIFISVIITFVVLVVLKISGKDIALIFGRKLSQQALPYQTGEDNIHEINFDEYITNAVAKKNYSLAIRFLYLKSLKKLSDANVISWHPEKTNHTYLSEITNELQRNMFLKLTRSFEYAWYGNAQVSEIVFNTEQNYFNEFNSTIR